MTLLQKSPHLLRTCFVRPLAALASLAGRALACMPVPLRGRAACRTNSPLNPCHRPNEIGAKSEYFLKRELEFLNGSACRFMENDIATAERGS
jgi:hypothetical protein